MSATTLKWGRTLLNSRGRELLRSSILVFSISMIGNVANYLYQFAMGRYLSLPDFGALNAILSLTMIISVPAATITLIKAKYVARLLLRDAWARIRTVYYELLKKTSLFAAVTAAVLLLLSPALRRFLNLADSWPLILFAVLVFWTLLTALNSGFFQGLQRFGVYSALGAGLGITRLVAAVVLVNAGFALRGALGGAILASVLIFGVSLLQISRLLRPYPRQRDAAQTPLNLFSTAASLFFLTSITYVDMVLVKHLFQPEEAGIYAGVSVLGKTILYLPGAITQVLLPKVSGAEPEESFHLLLSSALLSAGISLGGVILFYLYPEPLLRLFLGARYHGGADLLALYAVVMLLFALMTLFVNFCLARDIQDVFRALGIIFALQTAGLYFLGRSGFTAFLGYMILTGLAACVCLFIKIKNGSRTPALASGGDHHPCQED